MQFAGGEAYGQSGGYGQAPQQAPQQAPFGSGGGYAPPPAAPAPNYAPPHAPAPAAAGPSNAPAQATGGDKVIRGFLVSYQANPKGEFWPLAGGTTTIGRAGSGEAVDVTIADPTISSRHATFHVDGVSGAVLLEDTGSTNGTYVNEDHLGFNGKRDLRDGDRVRFGGYTALVKIIARI